MKPFTLLNPIIYIPILIVCIFLQRLNSYSESMDRDVGTYAVFAHEIVKGKSLYSGFILDQKPPGIYATYALVELIIGYGQLQIYTLGIIAATLTLLGTLLLRGSLSPLAAFYGAVFWVAICSTLPLEANQPNSEAFINAWMIFGLGLLFQKKWAHGEWYIAAGAGCCFAIASLYKHSTVTIPIFVSLSYLLWPIGGLSRRKALNNVVIIGLIGATLWLVAFLYFYATGRGLNFINWLFTHNQYYAGSIHENILNASNYFSKKLLYVSPLFLLSGFGIIIGFVRRQYQEVYFLLFLAFGTALAVALPGKFFPHYYQLWFPFIIIASAYGVEMLTKSTALPVFLRHALPVSIIVILLWLQYPFWALSSIECSNQKYGYIFINTEKAAQVVREILKPDERFFQIGDEPEIYFETGRSPFGPIAIGNGLQSPLASQISQELMNAVRSSPDLILLEKYFMPQIPKDSMLWKWLEDNYTPISTEFYREPFYFLARKNSDFEKRLSKSSLLK